MCGLVSCGCVIVLLMLPLPKQEGFNMPYIEEKRRNALEAYGYDGGPIPTPQTAGELNYCITTLINVYMEDKIKNYDKAHY